MSYRDVIADAIGMFEGSDHGRDIKCADFIIWKLAEAGYIVIRDRSDPEGGIPGLQNPRGDGKSTSSPATSVPIVTTASMPLTCTTRTEIALPISEPGKNEPRGCPTPGACSADLLLAQMRAATETGLEWLRHLEHLGSLVDQEALAGDIAKLQAALGVEQAAERTDG